VTRTIPTLVWCGRFGKDDGYGTAARSLLKAIRAAQIPYIAVDTDNLSIFGVSDEATIVTEKHGDLLTVRPVDNSTEYVVIVHDRPDCYSTVGVRGRARRVGYSYCEALTLPAGWITAMSAMDEVWTSSENNRAIFTDRGIPEWMMRIIPIPIDVDRELIQTERRSRWGDATVFLTVASAMARRDLRVLFEAYSQAFTAEDNVVLVLKVRDGGAPDTEAALTSVMLAHPGRRSGTWPRVEIIETDLTREQMHHLQSEADVYVSTERGNGWCIPAFDSMALARPVISFDWGGSRDFLDPEDSYIVPVHEHLVYGSDSLRVNNWMYDTNLWPTVDPVPLAGAFRLAADDPVDRQDRGRRAADRLRKTMDPDTVGRQLTEMINDLGPDKFISTDPAVVEIIGAGSRWSESVRPSPEKLLELRLIALANDPAFRIPRSPTGWFRHYKRIADLAVEQRRKLPDGSLLKEPVDALVTTPAGRPMRKLGALGAFRRATSKATKNIGGAGFPRELERTIQDHSRCVAGHPSEFDPKEAIERRQKAWMPIGGVKTNPADLERLAEIRGLHHGEQIFVLGNGPSLDGFDPSLLSDHHTFGVDQIFEMFPDSGWLPSFYTLLDWPMGPALADGLAEATGMTRFYPERFRGILPVTADTYWYYPRSVGDSIEDQFEPDATNGIPSRTTIVTTAVQLAFHLGFRDIVLLGVDIDGGKTGPDITDMKRIFTLTRKGVERHGGRLRDATTGSNLDVLERVDLTEALNG
jgi:glycosyltransferase involved in cell wall biosynthesis